MTDMELAEEIERRATYIRYGMQVNREECEQIIAALRRGHELSEKAVAWLIIHYSGTGKAKRQEREVVLTPLTDDTYMDEGDEAWPLYMHPERPPSGEMGYEEYHDGIIGVFKMNADGSRNLRVLTPQASEQFRAMLSTTEAEGRKS